MAPHKKVVLGMFVLAFLIMSAVSVCGQSDPTLSAAPNIVTPGDEIIVTYSGAPGFLWDWIAIFEVGDPNEWPGESYYLYGESSGSLTFTAPAEPGTYEFRLFEDDGYDDIARSNIVWVQEGAAETQPPTDSTPSQSLAEATLGWMGMTGDKVSKGNQPEPDGDLDGHFSLTLDPKGERTVGKITLLSADASGNPVGGQIWDTTPNYYWILGVEQPSGVKLNPTDQDISKRITTTTTFELYAANSGWFKAGQHFKVKVEFTDGTSAEALTTVTETPSSITPPEFSALIFESRSKPHGSTVQIPLTVTGATDTIGNMDITLSYDPSVLDAAEVIKGGLTATSLFDYNILDGTVKISLADEQGFSGDGSIAYVRFTVIGSEESSSPLRIVNVAANRAEDMAPLSISTQDGLFTVLGFEEGMGDCTGDGKITAADALCALEMAVGKIPEDLVMDVNGDGKVTSLDAREILKQAVEGGMVIQGKLEAFDTDNDGTYDKWRYTFDEVEIEDGLYEGEIWDFELTESEIRQMFTIRLENRGDKDYTGYTYSLDLPKEFAESVDDIALSIAPDRIINPDPEVAYDTDLPPGFDIVWELMGSSWMANKTHAEVILIMATGIDYRAKVKGKGSSKGPGPAPPVSPATSPTSPTPSTPTPSPRPPCGDYGRDCCPDETGAKTICYEGECQGGKCIHCGSWGEPCCAGGTCIDYDSRCIGNDSGPGVCFHESDDCGHVGYRPCSRDGDKFCYDGVLDLENNICLACGDYYQPCCQYTDDPCDYGNCSNQTYPYTDGKCLPTPGPTQMVFPAVSFKGPVIAPAGNYYLRDAGNITLRVTSTGQVSGNWEGRIMEDSTLRYSYTGTFSGEISHPAAIGFKDVEGNVEIKVYKYDGTLELTRSGKMCFWGGGITPTADASGTITGYTAWTNIRIDTNGDGRWDNDLFTWESE